MANPERLAADMAAIGRETDRLLHEAAQRMTPALRLATLARCAGTWLTISRDFEPKAQRRFLLNRLAHDRRIYGWREPQDGN